MLKVIAKFLIILLVIAVLGVGMYFLVQNNSSGTALTSGRSFGDRDFFGDSSLFLLAGQGTRPRHFEGGDHDGASALSVGRGLTGILGNIIEIALITLVVVVIRMALKPRRRAPVGNRIG